MSGLVIVPTRGRPYSALELWDAWQGTVTSHQPALLFCVDDNDPALPAYQSLAETYDWNLQVAPRLRIGPILNRVAVAQAGAYPWIGFMGDDHRPRTRGWDQAINYALTAPGVAYGNDLIQGPLLPTAAFVHSDLINRLGYMVPPGLMHMYLDNFWLMLGEATHLHYLPELVFEHLHPIAGKAEWTEQYAEVNGLMPQDAAEFARYLMEDWPADKRKLVS